MRVEFYGLISVLLLALCLFIPPIKVRGQLAAEGFPLVGDAQYGGAVPKSSSFWREKYRVYKGDGDKNSGRAFGAVVSYLDSEHLALQCCELKFLHPIFDGSDKVRSSDRWNLFRLDQASWTPYLKRYQTETAKVSSSEVTSSFTEMPLLNQRE